MCDALLKIYIDHNILAKKLEHYAIRGLAKDWVCSYLDNRRQYVCINDSNSDCLDVKCGVPQGSILGPALFILYVNDMCNVSKSLKSILFADDTNLFYSGKDINEVCELVSRELDILHMWFQDKPWSSGKALALDAARPRSIPGLGGENY